MIHRYNILLVKIAEILGQLLSAVLLLQIYKIEVLSNFYFLMALTPLLSSILYISIEEKLFKFWRLKSKFPVNILSTLVSTQIISIFSIVALSYFQVLTNFFILVALVSSELAFGVYRIIIILRLQPIHVALLSGFLKMVIFLLFILMIIYIQLELSVIFLFTVPSIVISTLSYFLIQEKLSGDNFSLFQFNRNKILARFFASLGDNIDTYLAYLYLPSYYSENFIILRRYLNNVKSVGTINDIFIQHHIAQTPPLLTLELINKSKRNSFFVFCLGCLFTISWIFVHIYSSTILDVLGYIAFVRLVIDNWLVVFVVTNVFLLAFSIPNLGKIFIYMDSPNIVVFNNVLALIFFIICVSYAANEDVLDIITFAKVVVVFVTLRVGLNLYYLSKHYANYQKIISIWFWCQFLLLTIGMLM